MNHVAIDLGSRKSQLCVRSPEGNILQEARVATEALEPLLRRLDKSRVVLEACAEAFAVADLATKAGHEVCIVPSTLAPSLGVGQRGVKTDVRDARNLSETSCRMSRLPKVHCPTAATRDLRSRLSARTALVSSRTMLVNHVRGWARGQLLKISSGTTNTFPRRAREAAEQNEAGLPSYIDQVLNVIDSLNKEIAQADEELQEMTEADEVCRRLMSVPGVGPVTAMSFRAAIEDVSRFKHAHTVSSYLGLTPGENSSGQKTNRLGITKAGSPQVRRVLVQAAWAAYRTRPQDPMVQWARKLAEKKPSPVAAIALARKMSGILFAIWRDETTYSPTHQQ